MPRFSSYVWLPCLVLPLVASSQAQSIPTGSSTVSTAASQPPQTPDLTTYKGVTTKATYTSLSTGQATISVTPVSESLRQEFSIPKFYTKGVVVRGIPILSSDKASDYALLECAYTLDHMFAGSPSWVQAALTKAKTRMSVMSVREYTMDLPESEEWQTDRTLKTQAFWDKRARGMGGLPDASCAEENLLNLPSDPYKTENITIHEFSHTLADAIKASNPQWYERLEATYKAAMASGRFAHSYAANNEQEYWAEGTQDWFSCNDPAKNSIHNGIWNREQLKLYDPDLAKLLSEVYGEGTWRYTRTDGRPLRFGDLVMIRPATEKAHLAGLNRSELPAFNFNNSPRIQAFNATEPTETSR